MTSTSQTDDDERSKMPQTNKEENELESPAPPSFPNYNHTTLSSPRPSRQRRLRRNSSVHKVGSKPQQEEASISAVDAALADLQALLENDNDESLTPEKQQQTGSVHSSPSTLSNTSGASHSPAQIRHVPVKRAMAFSEPPPAKRQNHPPKVAKSKQSIVGTRPIHWGQRDSRVAASFYITNRQQRKAALTAALRNTGPSFKMTHRGTTVSSFAPRALVPKDPPPSHSTVHHHGQVLPSPHTTTTLEISPATGGRANMQGRLSEASIFSPRSSHKSGSSNVWSKQLQSIRDRVKGDVLRLQSGQYAFSEHASHPNDPRQRAKTHCDVTIVQLVAPTPRHVRALAHVHHWGDAAQPNDSHRAWIWFTHETSTFLSLCEGSQIRIYNPVKVPSKNKTLPCTVVCTQLCEPYPDALSPLPNVSSL